MSRWDAKRDVIILDASCLAAGCKKPIVHTADMQPDLWCKDHLEGFRNSWLAKEGMKIAKELRDSRGIPVVGNRTVNPGSAGSIPARDASRTNAQPTRRKRQPSLGEVSERKRTTRKRVVPTAKAER